MNRRTFLHLTGTAVTAGLGAASMADLPGPVPSGPNEAVREAEDRLRG